MPIMVIVIVYIYLMYLSNNKVVAAVCHGAFAITNCCKSDGKTPLVKGLEFTALSNQEEVVVSGWWFEKYDIIPSNLVYNTSQRLNYLTWEVNIKNQRKTGHPYFVSLMTCGTKSCII